MFGFKARTIVAEQPRRHIFWDACADGNDDVREHRPRVVEIVLRWPGRVVWMRMIEPNQLGAQFPCASLGCKVILGANEKSPARTLFRCVRQPEGGDDVAIAAEQGTAALVRVSLDPMLTDGVCDAGLEFDRH
jgi:hypothetical protein